MSESEGIGAQVLVDQGVDLSEVRTAVQEMIGQGDKPPSGYLPFTPLSKKVLELSLRDRVNLAPVRERDGVACQVLATRGVDLEALRTAVAEKLLANPAN